MKPIEWGPAVQLRSDVRNLVIAGTLIVGLIVWFMMAGKTDRVVYRGVDQTFAAYSLVHLNTEPSGNYVIERNAIFVAMKVGCRYDLNYDVTLGRHQRDGRTKNVRSATLVGC